MKRFAIGISLVLALGVNESQGDMVSWSLATGGNGHSYEPVLVPEGITWLDARDAAIAQGGYLATITSASENAFVFSLVSDEAFWSTLARGGHRWGPWLGGYQDRSAVDYSEPGGGWRWVSGEPWSYSAWGDYGFHQPDNQPAVEDYLQYWVGANPLDSFWNDLPNDPLPLPNYGINVVSYVVEYNSVPEPSTLALLGVGSIGLLAFLCRRRGR